jgi:hypothetical protein
MALVICSCVTVAGGLAGLALWNSSAIEASSASSLVIEEPTPVLELERRQPAPAERETARIVAQSTVPNRDLAALAQRLQGMATSPHTSLPNEPPSFELGDLQTFWVHDVQTNAFFTATAVLRYETAHTYWWVEDGYQVDSKDLERSAERFESQTYPVSHRHFGSEWSPGIDGDPHVYIFLGDVPGVGGYYSAPDEYPAEIRPHSNEHEMFYINLENATPGNSYFDGILAHEFQHMIHWALDRDEDAWVNEGLSELAGHVSGYDVGGSDYLFSMKPDTQLTTWTDLEESGPHYGASYLFLAYFLEQFGEKAVRQLVAEPANGIAGFDAVLATATSFPGDFHDLYEDWVIANYLDDTELAAGRYGYENLQLEQPRHAGLHMGYPIYRQATVRQYGTDYILLEGEGDLSIEITGSLVVPLVGNKTHSGEYQWWSNRADDGDATLTRAFDLSELEQATLQAWMWYDLETDYDYAYVEVSTDGGETWTLLANEHTTTSNPSGNSYGPALTGRSGQGEEPGWVQQSFDLSPYAGQAILIRFEVITDEALNYPGLAVDDITIPELGYSYDAERDDGGWQAEGWLRVTDHVPQDFSAQLVTIGEQTRVRQLPLDSQMRATANVYRLGRHIDRAVLVVSAMAPATTEWAAYSYRIVRK